MMMHIQKPLTLPCGVTLPNRIAKAAMSENMSPKHHGPTETLIQLYQRWARGGAGLIITGNIMIDYKAIAEPGNVLVEDKSDFELLQRWAQTVRGTDLHLWPQINHPGRQAIGAINKEVLAPSAVKTNIKGMSALFKQPRAMTEADINDTIERFGNTAAILKDAGFTGVQIHGAHGYLISQFLSPLVNQRKDQWGGSLENRARFVIEVYRNIRKKVGDAFPIGIKINSADFQRGGFSEEESMEIVQWLEAEGIDLVEISGGTYEQPAMTGADYKKSTLEREAYFMDYVKKVRQETKVPLMLTGGFRTAAVMEKALEENALDVIGLARPFALFPDLPKQLFKGGNPDLNSSVPKSGIKALDTSGFVEIKWHEIQLHRMAKGKAPDPKLKAYKAILNHMSLTIQKLLFGK